MTEQNQSGNDSTDLVTMGALALGGYVVYKTMKKTTEAARNPFTTLADGSQWLFDDMVEAAQDNPLTTAVKNNPLTHGLENLDNKIHWSNPLKNEYDQDAADYGEEVAENTDGSSQEVIDYVMGSGSFLDRYPDSVTEGFEGVDSSDSSSSSSSGSSTSSSGSDYDGSSSSSSTDSSSGMDTINSVFNPDNVNNEEEEEEETSNPFSGISGAGSLADRFTRGGGL